MAPPKKIKGRYTIKAKLGEGGMGVVYRAYDPPPMDRDVAVKTLVECTNRLSLQLFYKECELLKSMSHPNIVEIFDMGEFEDSGAKKPFFVMPLLQGQPLDELIRNASDRLTVERVVEIVTQTCRGLQAAHERGLIHRDLKPSNIFVMEDDSVKIIDFGAAHMVDSRSQSSGFQKGTLLYMAPEQTQFKPVSPQSDIFSLGVVCYEALTRRQPFRGTREEDVIQAILKLIPPPASEINPSVSDLMSRVVHKAMAKQAWNRYDSAREFGETLQRALRNEPIELFDPTRIQPRIQRATRALESGDYQFASEIVGELEAEGNLDPQITPLRTQIDRVARQKTIAQLLEGARTRCEEEEDPLALQKIQEILQLDPTNAAALGLKSKIEDRRSASQIEKWLGLAQQHIANHSYNHARQALQNVLQLRPNEPRATRLLTEVESEEQEYLRLRQEKGQIYQAALNSWKNGDVSEALSQMRRVLDLDRQAPDTSSPETSGTYQGFYNQVHSEYDAIKNGYAEARRQLADREFAKALKVCQDFLEKYPSHALFQALKFDIEEQQGQQLSAFIADVDRRLEAETDLDVKLNLLREALASYPTEAHFSRLLATINNKRDLVNSILAKARLHEERGQINEALDDFEILRTIYSPYPGWQFEVKRLQKRLEQQTRDAAKANWVGQIDRNLQAGDYSRCLLLLREAQAEFPNDLDLVEFESLAQQGFERTSQAEKMLTEGQDLCAQDHFEQGLEILRKAYQLDARNPMIRAALRDLLIERSGVLLESDYQTAEVLVDQALELDPNNALARSLKSQALDCKRDVFVTHCVSQARRLQVNDGIEAAAAEVDRGLAVYPTDPRLVSIRDTLKNGLGQPQHRRARLSDVDQPKEPEVTGDDAERHPGEPDGPSIAQEVERIAALRGGRAPTPGPKAAAEKGGQTTQGLGLSEKLRSLFAEKYVVLRLDETQDEVGTPLRSGPAATPGPKAAAEKGGQTTEAPSLSEKLLFWLRTGRLSPDPKRQSLEAQRRKRRQG